MKTFLVTAAFVVIGFMFSRAMYSTAKYFIESIKRKDEER